MFENILLIIGGVFIVEGLFPFLFPKQWKKIMSDAVQSNDGQVRTLGLISLAMGLFMLALHSF